MPSSGAIQRAVENRKDQSFEQFLEDELDTIEALVTTLVVEHMRKTRPGKPLDQTILKIKEWLGDDWHIDLSEGDQKVVGAHEGWGDPEWTRDSVKLWKEGNDERRS